MVAESKNYKKLEGKYTVVGLDLDTTGRRLIDEIVHVAAYTSNNDQFSQYIMPLMNLNPGARARHQIRVITVGFFRMLKSMVDYKVIKTKTEIATVMEFLSWCEKVNGTNEGIIFVYHEQIKFVPYMMIEVMKKYNLSDRFGKIVKGFVNGYDLLAEEQSNKLKYLSLTENLKLQKEVLKIEKEETSSEDKEKEKQAADMEGNASRRACLSYEICKLMSHRGELKELDDKSMEEQITQFVCSKALPLEAELEELVIKEESLTRQAGMRDIFIAYFSASRYHRRRAVAFRRALADANHDKDTLQEIWNTQKREGLENLVKGLESIEKDDHEEFINILDCYFDEEKKVARPPTNPNAVNNHRRDSGSNNGNGNGRNYNNGGNHNNKGGRDIRRRHSSRNMHAGNAGKENRGGDRNNSRRRNNRPQNNNNGNNNRRRFSGNGNVGHEMNQKMYKEHQHQANDAHPQMTSV